MIGYLCTCIIGDFERVTADAGSESIVFRTVYGKVVRDGAQSTSGFLSEDEKSEASACVLQFKLRMRRMCQAGPINECSSK